MDIDSILSEAQAAIGEAANEQALDEVRVRFLGKKGELTALLKGLGALEPAEPVRRYERQHPGELIHIDIKKLGKIDGVGHRITGDRRGQLGPRGRKTGGYGWEYVHVCIDDHSRVSSVCSLPHE